MKKILVLIALSFMTVSTLTAQMKDPQNWVGYEEIMGVKNGLRFYDFDVNLIESSAPANVFWPGDDIRLKFQLINNTSQSIDNFTVALGGGVTVVGSFYVRSQYSSHGG